MLRQSEHGLEKNFDTEHFRRECLLRAGRRDNEGLANAAGQLLTNQGELMLFMG